MSVEYPEREDRGGTIQAKGCVLLSVHVAGDCVDIIHIHIHIHILLVLHILAPSFPTRKINPRRC